MDTRPIAEFFDHEVDCGCHTPTDSVSRITGQLLSELELDGLDGRTVLELGCGQGALAIESLVRGAARVTGLDLSPASIEMAQRRASAARGGERATFLVGDAASVALDRHDAVVLDKVICCYPDPGRLLANSLPAAGAVYAFAVPASQGLRGRLARAALALENTVRRLRRNPFRAYVHDVQGLHGVVTGAGFELRSFEHRWMWHLAVFRRRHDGSE